MRLVLCITEAFLRKSNIKDCWASKNYSTHFYHNGDYVDFTPIVKRHLLINKWRQTSYYLLKYRRQLNNDKLCFRNTSTGIRYGFVSMHTSPFLVCLHTLFWVLSYSFFIVVSNCLPDWHYQQYKKQTPLKNELNRLTWLQNQIGKLIL